MARSGWWISAWRLKSGAVVVSVPAGDTDRALVTIVPHTTSPRQSRFEATVPVRFLKAGAFDAQNLITIPHAKLIRQLGTLGKTQFGIVERAMCLWLGLPSSGIGRSDPTL